MNMDFFLELHRDMPRQGPGSPAVTRRAFGQIPSVPRGARILDIGCGPGQQTLELARLVQPCGGAVTAVDLYGVYLDELRRAADAAGLDNITCRTGDMRDLPFDDGAFDILWCEAAVYIMGFENALTGWKRLLKPGGALAVSEIAWLTGDIPAEVHAFWTKEYPAMQSLDGNLRIIRRCGWDVLDHFTLPPSAWLDEYYAPLEKRIAQMGRKYGDRPDVAEMLQAETAEITLYRKHSDCFGYEFFILRR